MRKEGKKGEINKMGIKTIVFLWGKNIFSPNQHGSYEEKK